MEKIIDILLDEAIRLQLHCIEYNTIDPINDAAIIVQKIESAAIKDKEESSDTKYDILIEDCRLFINNLKTEKDSIYNRYFSDCSDIIMASKDSRSLKQLRKSGDGSQDTDCTCEGIKEMKEESVKVANNIHYKLDKLLNSYNDCYKDEITDGNNQTVQEIIKNKIKLIDSKINGINITMQYKATDILDQSRDDLVSLDYQEEQKRLIDAANRGIDMVRINMSLKKQKKDKVDVLQEVIKIIRDYEAGDKDYKDEEDKGFLRKIIKKFRCAQDIKGKKEVKDKVDTSVGKSQNENRKNRDEANLSDVAFRTDPKTNLTINTDQKSKANPRSPSKITKEHSKE